MNGSLGDCPMTFIDYLVRDPRHLKLTLAHPFFFSSQVVARYCITSMCNSTLQLEPEVMAVFMVSCVGASIPR